MISETARELDLGMSNFDSEIDTGFADALKGEPTLTYGRHSAWEFNGIVWFEDNLYHEEVYRYRELVGQHSAPSLDELMKTVNDEHGWA